MAAAPIWCATILVFATRLVSVDTAIGLPSWCDLISGARVKVAFAGNAMSLRR